MTSKESIFLFKTNLEVKINKNVIQFDVRNSGFPTEKPGNLAFVVT